MVILCALSVFLFANSTTQAQRAQPNENVDRVIISFGEPPNQDDIDLIRSIGGLIKYRYQVIDAVAATIPAGLRGPLAGDPRVVRIEDDILFETFEQTLPTGVDRIEADNNGTASIDNNDDRVNVDIAIIDTGIDGDHEDLNVVDGRNFSNGPSSKWDDGNGHGTHVAGTAAALDNGHGVVGVAPGARLWAVRVLDNSGRGWMSDIIAGVDWVTENAEQIEVANMSLGAQGQSATLRQAIQNSVSEGVVYVVAAGNDSRDVYGSDGTFGTNDDYIPAAYPEVATISAMADSDGNPGGNGEETSYGADDSFASFSNFSHAVGDNPVDSPGEAIDLLLPGVDIFSTWPDNGYNTISGTSMASPHAAGLAALHIASNGLSPSGAGDVYAIRQALINNGVAQDSSEGMNDLNDPDDNWENIGWAGEGAPSLSITNPTEGATVFGTITLEAEASDSDGSVAQVEFFVDATSIGTDEEGSDGWNIDWDTTQYAEGDHTVTAEASDDDSKTAADSITVTIDNNDEPSVTITSPNDGATVSGSVDVTADASDSDGSMNHVEFFVDGNSIGTDTDDSDGWAVTWDSTSVSDGDHTVTAEATDDEDESASHSITVTVDNTDGDSAPSAWVEAVVEVNSPSPHAEFDVSWSASDDDGDLDSAELTLHDDTGGGVEQSEAVDISGGSASGTTRLKAKHDEGSSNSYTVELIVTDANGNQASDTISFSEGGS